MSIERAHRERQDKAKAMPKEIRYLLFSSDELRDCLHDYANGHAAAGTDRYDAVHDVSLTQTPDGGVGVHVKLRKQGTDEVEERDFVASDLNSALLLFCSKRGIPLAKRAHKSAEIFSDQIALMMTIDFPNQGPSVKEKSVQYSGAEAQEAQSRVRRQ